MEEYKIGDEVKRISGSHGYFKQGDIGLIIGFKELIGMRKNIILKNDEKDYSHDPINLKLIKRNSLIDSIQIW